MSTDPAMARHQLGVKLRKLREARSLRLQDVAAELDVVPSTLSRIETGKAPTRRAYLATMLALYGVDAPSLQQLLAGLARDGVRKPWWAAYADLLPAGVGRYLGIEAAASLVRSYSTQIVPDLLQTREYAAAACQAARPSPAVDQIRSLVTVTMRRQEIVRGNLARLHMIIDQSALLRMICSREVMAAQLDHLHVVAARPTVTVQVATLAPSVPVLSPPFTVFSLTDPVGAEVKCSYGPADQVTINTRDADIRASLAVFATLTRTALPPDESLSKLGDLTRKYR
jgi:transcriptional regulator with XRE-family HTH domain